MSNTATHIKDLRSKIEKLEKDFKRGVPPFQGFTIDLYYGGNKETDIERISIGTIASEKEIGQQFYDLVLLSLKNSLKFWEQSAAIELAELTTVLANKKD